jgi:hypothetical protein
MQNHTPVFFNIFPLRLHLKESCMQLDLERLTDDSVALSLEQRFEGLRVGAALHDPERQIMDWHPITQCIY